MKVGQTTAGVFMVIWRLLTASMEHHKQRLISKRKNGLALATLA